jgi:hypothetical protein
VYLIYSHNSGLQAIQRYRRCTHFTIHRYTHTRNLSLHYSYPGNGFITVSLSLQITHENLFPPPNSFFHYSYNLPTQFNSSAPKLIPRQAAFSNFDSTRLLPNSELILIITLHGPRGKHRPLLSHIVSGVFIDSLRSNRRPIFARRWLERQCVYRVVTEQWFYSSQYIYIYIYTHTHTHSSNRCGMRA